MAGRHLRGIHFLEPFLWKEKYTAGVTRFKPANQKIGRVAVDIGKGKIFILIFYESCKGDQLFWYDLAKKEEQGMAWAVAKKLLQEWKAICC